MDYEELFKELPKLPIRWKIQDVRVWLKFIGLQDLADKFQKLSIDGSVLCQLNESDLAGELSITSPIFRKKLMRWLKTGIQQYSQYVRANSTVVLKKPPSKEEEKKFTSNQPQEQRIFTASLANYPLPTFQTYQLKISNIQSSSATFYSVNQAGAKIGRTVINDIVVAEDSVSRSHSQIYFDDNINCFFIKDVGSAAGTFLKIKERLALQVGYIIEMGANQFQIARIEVDGMDKGSIDICIRVAPQDQQQQEEDHWNFELKAGQFKSVGRKNANNICFSQDPHLSGVHAKLYIEEGKFYIEDQHSTNGTWWRLSPQGKMSEGVMLQNQSIFKIGINNSYICELKKNQTDLPSGNMCIICCESDRDSMYLPCKHNICCFKCSKLIKDCPLCKTAISDIVKIYKS